MISNSIANRAIREHIERAFLGRGYLIAEGSPDFAVAYYATAREKLDVTMWDYGYPFYGGWPRYDRPVRTLTEYTEGSVIIDVIDPRTRELLWRGEGKARLLENTSKNVELLAKAAGAIIARFPQATGPIVVARP